MADRTNLLFVLIVAFSLSQVLGAEPYDLKGDRLGMSLEDYKKKYHRISPESTNKELPFCSSVKPGESFDVLLAEPWHHVAGIVNCSTTFVFENTSGKGPTIAEVPVILQVHHFIDSKLYKITVRIPRVGFSKVTEGLNAKYGKPNTVEADTRQNVFGAKFTGAILEWTNGVSTLIAGEFGEDWKPILATRAIQTSTIVFTHDVLNKLANSRRPKPTAKDL